MPYLAAAANGLFAESGLDVSIVDPSGGPANVKRVADGEAEFALTSVNHYLTARQNWGPLAARFVAVIARRSSASLIVPVPENGPAGISAMHGRRLGGPAGNPQILELLLTLRTRWGVEMEHVAMSTPQARSALGSGAIDAIAGFDDGLARYPRLTGIPVVSLPVGADTYASGLVAGDWVGDEVVAAMCDATVAALERQARHPGDGIEELSRRYPDADRAEALEGWRRLQPYVFVEGEPVGSMTSSGWARTLDLIGAARTLESPETDLVARWCRRPVMSV